MGCAPSLPKGSALYRVATWTLLLVGATKEEYKSSIPILMLIKAVDKN